MQAARKKMIKEKKRLLSDGVLTEDETRYFMKKYRYINSEGRLFFSTASCFCLAFCLASVLRLGLLLSCVWA